MWAGSNLRPLLFMVFIRTTNKWDAARAFINTWLKDKRWYCNNCGIPYYSDAKNEQGIWEPCCEEPQIGRNIDHVMGVIKQNKLIRETRSNDLAQLKDKTMRWGLSMPPVLLKDLENYFENNYHQKLFVDNKEMHKFMKEFPEFTICRKV